MVVRRDKRASHGPFCKGVFSTGQGCDRSRVRPGGPVAVGALCKKCKEQRCKAHCKCARKGSLQGHKQARTASKAASTSDTGTKPDARTTSAPLGRAPIPSCELLASAAVMYEQICSEMEHASEVELASYQYDNARVHDVLLRRLRGRRSFTLNVYVDREMLAGRTPKWQRTRLSQLKAAGAQVYVGRGSGRRGSFHPKGLVLDRRYLYCGSPNVTSSGFLSSS